MLVHWVDAPSEQTSTLKRSMQRSGSWADFVSALGKHEEGPKTGRIFFPYAAQWDSDAQPRAGAHELPEVFFDLVPLDLDHCTEDQVMAALAKLDEARTAYLCHTTHSFDPEGVTKTRIWIPLARPIKRDAVQDSRMRTARWLGLDMDKATKGAHMGFYTPRAPSEFLEDAWTIARTSSVYGPLYPELLPELSAPSETGLTKDKAQPQVRLVVAPRAFEQWPEDVRREAESQLQGVARWVAHDRSRHVRDKLKGRVSLLAGYGASGVIEQQRVYDTMADALRQRASLGRDDQSLAWRLKQLDDFLNWGEARPILPEGFDEHGNITSNEEALRSSDAQVRLKAQLIAQTPSQLYTAQEAADELHSFLRLPRRLDRWLGLVEVSVGVGKTYALRHLAAERAQRGEYTVILSLDHGLLGQIRRDLEQAGVAVRHLHALNQLTERTGAPRCAIADRADVRALVEKGVNLAGSVCPKCAMRPTCPAVKHNRRALQEYVVLAPYPMARRALAMIADANDSPTLPLLVCDEEPPPPERTSISLSAIQECVDDEYIWHTLRSDQANDVLALAQLLLSGDVENAPAELVGSVADYHGQLHAPDMTLLDLETHEGSVEALKAMLALANGWDTLKKTKPRGESEEHWECDVQNAAWQVLAQDGGYVLSATPTFELYESFPLKVESLKLRVKDAPATPAARVVLMTKHASRSQVLENGVVNWAAVEADLQEVFRLAPTGKMLLGTYKAISDELKGDKKHLLAGRHVDVTHYEVVRGRDDWREHEAFVSLYDPRIPSETFAQSTDAAARSLEQFHGRARDPQPRRTGAIHIHVGTVAPRSWWLDDEAGRGDGRTQVRVRDNGRPPNPLDSEIMLLLRLYVEHVGGRIKDAVATLGVGRTSWHEWITGKRSPSLEVVQKVRSKLDG
jgi:hypothetical protein